ncbi:hypothetical protein IHV25_08055 [Phaeovibrio sulfidiphilus]|uniref:Transmembrane protein n=1 Tax=Phaeovibrio sulfidiphilus TaxID=1220600 RepID=A0A8J6YMY4_9PROT|nr:hypothetical protein [Phaeovibrio sulfidiphilus]MBE1237600.1 hypothetical protein [Phaeovibrio sulfidiphilus]
MTTPRDPETPSTSNPGTVRGYVLIAYGLFLIGMLTGVLLNLVGPWGLVLNLSAVAGVGVLLMAREASRGTVYESHSSWLVRTFVITLCGFLVAVVLAGYETTNALASLLFLLVGLYYIFRVFKGFRVFMQARPMTSPRGWI